MDDLQNKIKFILTDRMGIPETAVTKDAHLSRDLGIDSLDYAELVMEFEQEFDIKIPSEDAEKLAYVEDVENYIRNKIE